MPSMGIDLTPLPQHRQAPMERKISTAKLNKRSASRSGIPCLKDDPFINFTRK